MTCFRSVLMLSFLFIQSSPYAQFVAPPSYPRGFFRNPLDIPISLSGNFGELRSNHFHMGLDLRTNVRENYPVYAAADGFVSRIKIEPGGFGRALYIQHPNGFTTLYAHLSVFNPSLEQWITAQQYQLKSWKIDIEPGRDRFPVKKGDFIARSGNTGASQAPHLHFEIRETSSETNLNPLFFGFPLSDHRSPHINRLALYDRTKSTYEQKPLLIPVYPRSPGQFRARDSRIIVDAPRISLALSAYDQHDASTNLNGITAARLFLDGKPWIGFLMDRISYAGTRYLNAHIDYRTRASGGPLLQHLSELPGYSPSIYHKPGGDGVIDLTDRKPHKITIIVQDAEFNTSTVETEVVWSGEAAAYKPCTSPKMFYPEMLDGFEADDCEFYIGQKCLYDSVRIRYEKTDLAPGDAVSALHAIGAPTVPLQEPFLIRIRPTRRLSALEKDRTLMLLNSGNRKDVQKVEWQRDWATARFRDFGLFRLLTDTLPPQIIPMGFSDGTNLSRASRMAFTVKDNWDKIKNVTTELDGEWIRFSNDKGRVFVYPFDIRCSKGPHRLRITAEDEAGNLTVRTYRFTR